MLYDNAEAVMAKLADEYPNRKVTMALMPRTAELGTSPRTYTVEMGLGAAAVEGAVIANLQRIAGDNSAQLTVKGDELPGNYLTALFD